MNSRFLLPKYFYRRRNSISNFCIAFFITWFFQRSIKFFIGELQNKFRGGKIKKRKKVGATAHSTNAVFINIHKHTNHHHFHNLKSPHLNLPPLITPLSSKSLAPQSKTQKLSIIFPNPSTNSHNKSSLLFPTYHMPYIHRHHRQFGSGSKELLNH